MTTIELIEKIKSLAGCQRDRTFPFAVEYALAHGFTQFIETGCYRGTDGDGQSTVILGALASQQDGLLRSFEINPRNIELAKMKAAEYLKHISFIEGDSVTMLSKSSLQIQFAYLDSYDFSPDNPGPSQRHQMAELGAIFGRMTKPGLILLDDCDLPHGGKGGISTLFLEERGWKLIQKEYQRIYIQE